MTHTHPHMMGWSLRIGIGLPLNSAAEIELEILKALPENYLIPWKWMVGRIVSFWDGVLSNTMSFLGSVSSHFWFPRTPENWFWLWMPRWRIVVMWMKRQKWVFYHLSVSSSFFWRCGLSFLTTLQWSVAIMVVVDHKVSLTQTTKLAACERGFSNEVHQDLDPSMPRFFQEKTCHIF